MTEIKVLSEIMIKLLGPLMLACLIIMYLQVYFVTGERPRLRGIILAYARYNINKRKHAGLLTYALILCSILFVLSIIGIVLTHFLPVA